MFVVGCMVCCAGCAIAPEPVALDLRGASPSADVSDLAAVLAQAVTPDGRVDLRGLAQVNDRLDRQLRTMAVTGPTVTPDLYPTYGLRWAYWYNARAAWSLRLVGLECARPDASCCRMRRRTFPLDGREMSLEMIDGILLKEARRTGDFRLAACIPGGAVNYACMPAKPFRGEQITSRLAEALSRLVLDERRFVIDVQQKTIHVPLMFWATRDLLAGQYRLEYGGEGASLTTALRPYVNSRARRRLDDGLGYKAVSHAQRVDLAIPKPKVYYPGRIGRIEP